MKTTSEKLASSMVRGNDWFGAYSFGQTHSYRAVRVTMTQCLVIVLVVGSTTGCAQLGIGNAEEAKKTEVAPSVVQKQDPNLPAMTLVKSRDGSFDGEMYGKPARGSSFSKLEFGMGQREVADLIGGPKDQKVYSTGKTFIPFYFGGDTHRIEYFYKDEGRLIFAGGTGMFSGGVQRLIKIVVDPTEDGYAQ